MGNVVDDIASEIGLSRAKVYRFVVTIQVGSRSKLVSGLR